MLTILHCVQISTEQHGSVCVINTYVTFESIPFLLCKKYRVCVQLSIIQKINTYIKKKEENVIYSKMPSI